MPDTSKADYSAFDHPDILSVLFHPRKDIVGNVYPSTVKSFAIPVEDGETAGAALHISGKASPTILFFHGNGEIVSDYNDIGGMFINNGINFFPVDYRGYGFSSGAPTVSSMMADCHAVFDYVIGWLADYGYTGKLVVMGRSLGSACALELADARADAISGLIVESGFAYSLPLLNLMGVDTVKLGLTEEKGFRNIEKVSRSRLPLLVIHAEYDHIIPFSDGQILFDRSPVADKYFVNIHGADHNNIFYYGIDDYMSGINMFVHNHVD